MRAGWTVLGVGLLAVAGCGGGASTAGPSPVPIITTSSSSATASSTAPAPSTSAPAVPVDSDGAVIAAAKAYMKALDEALRGAQIGPYEKVTAATCACRSSVQVGIDALQRKGWHEAGNTNVQSVRVQGRLQKNADVLVKVNSSAYPILDHNGATVKTEPAFAATFDLSLQKEGARWLVFAVRQLSS